MRVGAIGACTGPMPDGVAEDLTNQPKCHQIIFGAATYFKLEYL
jgi:hypothetical protein